MFPKEATIVNQKITSCSCGQYRITSKLEECYVSFYFSSLRMSHVIKYFHLPHRPCDCSLLLGAILAPKNALRRAEQNGKSTSKCPLQQMLLWCRWFSINFGIKLYGGLIVLICIILALLALWNRLWENHIRLCASGSGVGWLCRMTLTSRHMQQVATLSALVRYPLYVWYTEREVPWFW